MSERLTDEQLRELDERLRRAGPGEAIRVSSEELNAIRRGGVMFPNLTDAAELLALRARVAKLEAALQHARGVIEIIMSDGNCDCRKDFAIIDAALSEAIS